MLALPVRGCHPLRPDFPDGSGCLAFATGLVRVRSPLLAESRLMSFPPGTEMFQFPGFARNLLWMQRFIPSLEAGIRSQASASGDFPTSDILNSESCFEGGFPHSEIRGSKLLRSSPRLIAA